MSGPAARRIAAAIQRGPLRCAYCSSLVRPDVPMGAADRAVLVHLTPRHRGGTDRKSNTTIACYECACDKGPLTDAEYRRTRHNPAARKAYIRYVNGQGAA